MSVLTLWVNNCSVRVPSLLVWWRHQHYSYYAVLQCCVEYGVILDSLLISAQTTTTTSEYGIIRVPLVATRTNEEETSSDTLFSSFQKSKDWWIIISTDEVSTRVIIFYIFHIIFAENFFIFLFKVMHLVFCFFFLTREKCNLFSFMEHTFQTLNNMSARE